jgi:hypothetical protein
MLRDGGCRDPFTLFYFALLCLALASAGTRGLTYRDVQPSFCGATTLEIGLCWSVVKPCQAREPCKCGHVIRPRQLSTEHAEATVDRSMMKLADNEGEYTIARGIVVVSASRHGLRVV